MAKGPDHKKSKPKNKGSGLGGGMTAIVPQGSAQVGQMGLPQGNPGTPGGAVWVPPTPGVENKPVDPFWTADDLQALASATEGWGTQLNDIQTGLDNMFNQSTFDQTQIDKARIQDLNTSADEMAGRGLGQSSIKDADLYDIEATARLRKDYIDTQLKTATIAADRQRTVIQDARDSWMKAYNQKGVENAAGVNAEMPRWQTEPTEGKWTPPGYTSPQTAPRPPKPPAQEAFGFSQSQGANTNEANTAEAKARIGGNKGGRGRKPKLMGTAVGAGSAGIG